jgi:hypothetical protein
MYVADAELEPSCKMTRWGAWKVDSVLCSSSMALEISVRIDLQRQQKPVRKDWRTDLAIAVPSMIFPLAAAEPLGATSAAAPDMMYRLSEGVVVEGLIERGLERSDEIDAREAREATTGRDRWSVTAL